MAFVALLMVLGASFGGLAFMHNRLQASADELALEGARTLNAKDRLGQINNMIVRGRQLVYAQQSTRDQAASESEAVQHLADQLLNDSIQNAQNLESERQNVLQPVCQSEAMDAMTSKFSELAPSYTITLPWLQVYGLKTTDWRFGEIADVQSNVTELTGQSDLSNQDRSDSLLQTSPGLNLYKHDQNHKLHGPLSYLSFKLSSLPPPINKVVSPARVVLANEFRPTAATYLPSAVQVKLHLTVETGLGPSARTEMVAVGTAATPGASEQQ